jgi:MFS superfamily sulfate permease-like transporter
MTTFMTVFVTIIVTAIVVGIFVCLYNLIVLPTGPKKKNNYEKRKEITN